MKVPYKKQILFKWIYSSSTSNYYFLTKINGMWKTGFMTTKMYYLSVKYMENFVLLLENTKLIKDEKKLIELNKNHSDMIRALFEYNRIFQ